MAETEYRARRDILAAWLAAATAGGVLSLAAGEASAQLLPATPACGPDHGPTVAQTEGPYFRPSTPEKRSFRGDAPGEGFTLMGFVLNRRCEPIPNALIDLWHADAGGAYDNAGFRLRGHQFSDAQGRYSFETITPGVYPGRTRHYHVKVRPRGGRALTTQLYFPGEPGNARDFIFDRRLLMQVSAASDGRVGRYDFVLAV